MSDLVSVIIPTHGPPLHLESCILSVIRQSYDNIEIIIVDDNGYFSLNTVLVQEIVNSIDYNNRNFTYVCHPENLNGSTARNTGLKESKGRFIAFLDDDDYYLPTRVEECVSYLQNAPKSIKSVYSQVLYKGSNGQFKGCSSVSTGNHIINTLACKFEFGTGSNIFIYKDVLIELDGFDVQFTRHQDYEFLVRYFRHYSIGAIAKPLLVKNILNRNVPGLRELLLIKDKYLSKFHDIIGEFNEVDQGYIYRANNFDLLRSSLADRNFKSSITFYKKVCRDNSLTFKEWRMIIKSLLCRN